MKKVSPSLVALFMVSGVFAWLVLSFVIARYRVEHGVALDMEQRWIAPFASQYAGYSLYAIAIGSLALTGCWAKTATRKFNAASRRKNVNQTIRDLLRLSRTDEELLANLAKEGISFNVRVCTIPAEYTVRASTKWFARLLLALMRVHAKAIIDHLERIENYGDPSDTVFHSIATQMQNMHPDDVKCITAHVRNSNEFFGTALDQAVKYMKTQRQIDALREEQAGYIFDAAAEAEAITAKWTDQTIRRRAHGNVISWAIARVALVTVNKIAPVKTAA